MNTKYSKKNFMDISRLFSIILFYLLLSIITQVSVAYAGQVSIGSADLPYTASTAYDTITLSASKISSSTHGIYVTADYVTIDLRDDTLEFATSGGDSCYGIYTAYNIDHLTILGNPATDSGGLILHDGINGVDTSWDCVCVMGGSSDITITNVDMLITGYDGHNVQLPASPIPNYIITGGTLLDRNYGYTSRISNDGVSIWAGYGNLTLNGAIVDSWGHGVYVGGVSQIYNCSIMVDARNDLYEYPTNNTAFTSLGAGCIDMYVCEVGTTVHDNILVAGSENEGCAGAIGVTHCTGTAENPIEIYNNYMNFHRGGDDHYGPTVTVRPYKQRWMNKHIHFHDNTIIVSTHPDSGAHAAAWSFRAEGIDMLWVSAADGSEGTFRDSFTVIENNRIFAYALDTGCEAVGIRLAVRGEDEVPPFDWVGAGNIIRNNYYEVAHSAIEFGKGDGGICQGVLIQGDTVALTDSGVVGSPFYPWKSGDYSGGISENNILRDITYIGSINETNIEWDPANDGDEMFYERTLQVNVRGNNDSLIANATVRVYNYDSTLADTGTTGSYGYLKDMVTYYYAAEAVADTSYSPFNIEVSVGSYTGDSVVTVGWNTGSIEITLDTIGTLPLAGGVDPETNNVLITGGIFRGATIR